MGLTYYAYLHARPDDSIFYVGKGSGRRAWSFAPSQRTQRHRRIALKYGLSAIQVSLIYAESEAEAFAIEQEWIASLKASGVQLINQTEGGEGFLLTPELIKQRAATLRATNLLPEVRERRSKALLLAFQNPEFRERHAVNTAAAARRPDVILKKLPNLKRIHSDPEIKKRRLESMRKTAATDEYKEKKRKIALEGGNRPPTYHGSDHPMAKKVVCIETGETFSTVRFAVAWLKDRGSSKASPSAIVAACRGRLLSAYKYHWKYAET